MTVCYRSVFKDYWQLTHDYGKVDFIKPVVVTNCVVVDSLTFNN